MPSFTTICRAAVMIVIAVVIVKGWRLYGPSTEQVKSTAVSAIDMAETAWKNWQTPTDGNPSNAEATGTAPRFGSGTQPQAANSVAAPAVTLAPANAPSMPSAGSLIPNSGLATSQPPVAPLLTQAPPESAANGDRLQALMSRLAQLGAAEPKLSPWGSSGQLFRFCCRAPVGDSPTMTQHFESVAAEPAIAVEQVVAKVEAWRTAQRDVAALR